MAAPPVLRCGEVGQLAQLTPRFLVVLQQKEVWAQVPSWQQTQSKTSRLQHQALGSAWLQNAWSPPTHAGGDGGDGGPGGPGGGGPGGDGDEPQTSKTWPSCPGTQAPCAWVGSLK